MTCQTQTNVYATSLFSILLLLQAGQIISWMQSCIGLGYMLGPGLGSVLYELGGFKLPFLAVGSVSIILSLLLVITVPNIGRSSLTNHKNMESHSNHFTEVRIQTYSIKIHYCNNTRIKTWELQNFYCPFNTILRTKQQWLSVREQPLWNVGTKSFNSLDGMEWDHTPTDSVWDDE